MVIVESGWGSILPTVIIANMMHAGPAEKSGRLNIGDQIMSINGTSLVGLPLSTCQSIIKVINLAFFNWNVYECMYYFYILLNSLDASPSLEFLKQLYKIVVFFLVTGSALRHRD